jgi:protein SDA1
LLEDHLNAQRAEQGDEDEEMEDEEAAWEGWDVESNSPDDSDDSTSWHNVESDGGEAFDVSDIDDEPPKKTDKGKGEAMEQKGSEEKEDVEMKDGVPRVSTLATTKVSPTSQSPKCER